MNSPKTCISQNLKTDNDFLPHLWAQGRIAELVDQAALGDGSDELYKEIERLSKKYGVPTPYTSFVDADDGSLRKVYDDSRISDAYTAAIPIPERIRYSRELEERKHARYKPRQDANTRYIGRKTFQRHVQYVGRSPNQNMTGHRSGNRPLSKSNLVTKPITNWVMNHLPDLAKYSKLAKDALVMII